MPGERVDESILAHSCYGPLVKIQGLINGGWTGRTIYLQFRQGHRQQSNCFHGNPGDSGTPRRQNGFSWISHNRNRPGTRSNTATASMPDPVPLRSVPSWLLSSRPGHRHTSTYTPPATTTRQLQTSQVDTVTHLCRWAAGRLKQPATDGTARTACHPETCPATLPQCQGRLARL